jgi:hypothetical protein
MVSTRWRCSLRTSVVISRASPEGSLSRPIPAAAAEPVTEALLDAYSEWLFYDRRLLCLERWPGVRHPDGFIPANTGASGYHFPLGPERWQDRPQPSTRAAVVLSAVGCGWQEGPWASLPR